MSRGVSGAAASLALLLRAGRLTSRLLLVLMACRVLAPFVAAGIAGRVTGRWPDVVRAALNALIWSFAVSPPATYLYDAVWPRPAQPAFLYVFVPGLSWLLLAVALTLAALRSRGRTTHPERRP